MQIGTFEVTSQYFAYFISISSQVFENDKWMFWGLLWAFQHVSPPKALFMQFIGNFTCFIYMLCVPDTVFFHLAGMKESFYLCFKAVVRVFYVTFCDKAIVSCTFIF